MEADFSIEMGSDDPVLDFPWTDPAGKLAYLDLKRQPELLARIEEAREYLELREFLKSVNSARSLVESAKCDVWESTELSVEEEIFNATHKFASYIDVVFSDIESRRSLARNKEFARSLVELLRRVPEIGANVEICVRRCFFDDARDVREGCYFTVYLNGYGNDVILARRNWGIALKLLANAIAQLSARVQFEF
jgi:hypothetical protein